jgi:hypothetical protein
MIQMLPRSGFALAALLLAGGLLAAVDAVAQGTAPNTVPGVSNGNLTGPVVGGSGGYTARRILPPALPGARPGAAQAAAPDRPPSDLNPNDALFDAIVRGDIASAREALGRGADLGARNVLGMTPLESSIDLNRNDITFLLISLRGGAPGKPNAAAVAAGQAPGNQPGGKPAPVKQAAVRPAPKPAPTAKPAPPPAQFADIPSTPVPQAGFLGFGNATDGKAP